MFGGMMMGDMIKEGVFKIADYMHDEEMQEDAQQFNSTEALRNRDWQTMMAKNRYRFAMEDMRAGGLNPMLAYQQGGGPVPGGATASSGIASSASGRGVTPLSASFVNQSVVDLNSAAATKQQAEASLVRAQEENVRADTVVKQLTPEVMRQNIAESVQRVQQSMAEINKIVQDERTSAASAVNLHASANKLRAEIPQVEAMVRQLNSLSALQGAMKGKTEAETAEIKQRVKVNLPEIERRLRDVQVYLNEAQKPQAFQNKEAHSGFAGAVGALFRALLPLSTTLTLIK